MKTIEEIYDEMLAVFRRETGTEASAVSDLSVRLYAAAAQVYALYVQGEWLIRQVFPQTAEGTYLERHAALRGLERRPAGKAEGIIRFSVDEAASSDLSIPAGTVCVTAGQVRFETVEDAVIPAGDTKVETAARAAEAGTAGNVPAGAVQAMAVAPVGVSRCVNPDAFTGGTDEEDDEALRGRVLETYRRMPNGANTAFYEQGALSFDEVAAAAVLPRNRGRGTVDVVVATRTGLPGEELLSQLTDWFEARREIAVDVEVKAPAVKSVDVTVSVTPKEGVSPDTVTEAVRSAIQNWFSGERLSRSVLVAQLYQLVFSQEGVANCAVTVPDSDVMVEQGELPVLGTLTVESAE
ncbi:MAG: baseplate J/gp47 family protein [Clostridiales bacterium]|nr:baseplate J/gp47 family protein [Clostridiales bacterium]